MTDTRKIIIDDKELEVDGAMTLIQACEEAGVEIPRFCYHERLSIAGNCRMCLVEVVDFKPAACAMQGGWAWSRGAASAGENELANGQKGPRGGDGISPDQPSAGLPYL